MTKTPKTQPQPSPIPNTKPNSVVFDEMIEDKKSITKRKQELLDTLLEDAGNFKKYTDYDAPLEHLDVLRRTICKGLTNAEFYYYLQVCHQLGLDPYLKQVWCYKDNKDNLVTIVGRDGYFAHCEKQPGWKGMNRGVIYANDIFIPDYANNTVQHSRPNFTEPGKIIGAWAICRREGFQDILMTVYFDEYAKTYDRSPWKSNPSSMITKVAELEAMRKQFPMSGVQNEHDWIVDDKGVVKPNDKIKNLELANEPEVKSFQRQLIDLLADSKSVNKEQIRKSIIADKTAGTLTQKRFDHYKNLLTNDTTEEE